MKKVNYQEIINKLQETQMRDDHPDFSTGDTIAVHLKITEGNKTRVQKFEGIVMKIRGRNTNKMFTIRKISYGVGVENTFAYHSPQIVKIEVVKRGKVRRAYISYMRNRFGKAARIKENKNTK